MAENVDIAQVGEEDHVDAVTFMALTQVRKQKAKKLFSNPVEFVAGHFPQFHMYHAVDECFCGYRVKFELS